MNLKPVFTQVVQDNPSLQLEHPLVDKTDKMWSTKSKNKLLYQNDMVDLKIGYDGDEKISQTR